MTLFAKTRHKGKVENALENALKNALRMRCNVFQPVGNAFQRIVIIFECVGNVSECVGNVSECVGNVRQRVAIWLNNALQIMLIMYVALYVLRCV